MEEYRQLKPIAQYASGEVKKPHEVILFLMVLEELGVLTVSLLMFLTGVNVLAFIISKPKKGIENALWYAYALGGGVALILQEYFPQPLIAFLLGSVIAVFLSSSVVSKEVKPNLVAATILQVKFKNEAINSLNSLSHRILAVLIAGTSLAFLIITG